MSAKESTDEMISRLEQMAAGSGDWDLSDNDRAAIAWLIARGKANPAPTVPASQAGDLEQENANLRSHLTNLISLAGVDPQGLQRCIDQMAANAYGAGSPAGLDRLEEISRNLKTQDNRITQDPIFVVQQKQRVWGPDQGDYVWKDDEWNDVDASKAEELDTAHDSGEPTTGYTKAYYEDMWVFVTACFTEQGCKDYLRVNGHNLIEPRIYAESAFRNAEWIYLRKLLMERPAALAAPVALGAAPTSMKPKSYQFEVDGKRYWTDKRSMSGAEIKHVAGVDSTYQLIDADIPVYTKACEISDLNAVDFTQGLKRMLSVPPATY